MSKPFDATLNSLIDARPEDWVAFLAPRVGLTPGPAEVLDTDLSVTAQADKVFRLVNPPHALIHLELEANPRLGIPADLLRYNVLAGHNKEAEIYTVLLLLRPKANASDLTGVYRRACLEFGYAVVRVWEESVDSLLAGGPTTAPLALLTDEAASDLTGAFARFETRLRQPDVPDNLAKELFGSTFVLCGLRYTTEQATNLYRSLSMLLEDSTTYQQILNKGHTEGRAEGLSEGTILGAAEHARRMLLLQGRQKFGPPPATAEATLQGITDPDRLDRMIARVLGATGWADLLATA